MPWDERAEIIKSIRGVKEVIMVDDSDGTVCQALEAYEPTMFGNGGDRTTKNTPEKTLCKKLGIKMVWRLGGGKIQSSSDLVKDVNWAPPQTDDPDVPKPDKSIILRGKKHDN